MDALTLETLAIKVPPDSAPTIAPSKASGSGAPRTSGAFEPKILDSVSRELAAYIGPIAKVVVKRAADRCSSVEELYACVAAEIDSERDRSQFLAKKKG